MTQPSSTISAMIVRYVNGKSTPDEMRQLKEWASLSAENRLWLQQFSDRKWILEQAIIHIKIDLDEASKKFWAMVAAESTPPLQATQQNSEPVKGKPWLN